MCMLGCFREKYNNLETKKTKNMHFVQRRDMSRLKLLKNIFL